MAKVELSWAIYPVVPETYTEYMVCPQGQILLYQKNFNALNFLYFRISSVLKVKDFQYKLRPMTQ